MKILVPMISKTMMKHCKSQFNIAQSLLNMQQLFFAGMKDKILLRTAHLQIRNSDTLNLKLFSQQPTRKREILQFPLSTSSTLESISQIFEKQFNAFDTQFMQDQTQISKHTPLEAFLDRTFAIISIKQGYKIFVQGQLVEVKSNDVRAEQLKDNILQLQLPIITLRQIEAYFNRVEKWLNAKYGSSVKQKIKGKEIQDILVQAIMDPQANWGTMSFLESQWINKYNQVRSLRQKKQEALKISEKMAVRKMYLGLGLIGANIGFIWSGTYVFFSWDIIQPIAYFTSSIASITLFSQILKLKKPFSLENYKDYLANKYFPTACEKIGLNLSDLNTKQAELQVVQSTLKDYLISKL